jgi:hypothetical protein
MKQYAGYALPQSNFPKMGAGMAVSIVGEELRTHWGVVAQNRGLQMQRSHLRFIDNQKQSGEYQGARTYTVLELEQ